MRSLGDVFGELFVQRGAARTISSNRHPANEVSVLGDPKGLPQGALLGTEIGVQGAGATEPAEAQVSPERSRILNLFTARDDTFELSENRLKASNGTDYLRRLTYLFLYANECHGRTSALESDLKAVLRKAKIIDPAGNASRWLAKRIGFVAEGEDRIKLNAKGREEAKKALDEALDAKLADTWNPDLHRPKKRKPRKKKA
jgi:hypothetical protein